MASQPLRVNQIVSFWWVQWDRDAWPAFSIMSLCRPGAAELDVLFFGDNSWATVPVTVVEPFLHQFARKYRQSRKGVVVLAVQTAVHHFCRANGLDLAAFAAAANVPYEELRAFMDRPLKITLGDPRVDVIGGELLVRGIQYTTAPPPAEFQGPPAPDSAAESGDTTEAPPRAGLAGERSEGGSSAGGASSHVHPHVGEALAVQSLEAQLRPTGSKEEQERYARFLVDEVGRTLIGGDRDLSLLMDQLPPASVWGRLAFISSISSCSERFFIGCVHAFRVWCCAGWCDCHLTALRARFREGGGACKLLGWIHDHLACIQEESFGHSKALHASVIAELLQVGACLS